MGVLDWLLGKPSNAAAGLRPEPDESDQGDALLDGYEFHATLNLSTPLKVLRRHGEISRGRPAKICGPEHGVWLPKTKSWRALGIEAPELPRTESTSTIGAVDDREFVPFLIAFREIYESDASKNEKVARIRRLRDFSPKFKAYFDLFSKTIDGFPLDQFGMRVIDLPGIGQKSAANLAAAGFKTQESVLTAPDSELLAVRGIGKAAVRKIRRLSLGLSKPQD